MKLNPEGQLGVMNPQGRFPPFLLRAKIQAPQPPGGEHSQFIGRMSALLPWWVAALCGGSLVRLPTLGRPRFCVLSLVSCSPQKTKVQVHLVYRCSHGKSQLSCLALLSLFLSFDLIIHFLASLSSILSCFFSRFAQGTWSIILKEIHISPSHHGQVLLKNREHLVF